MIYSKKRTCVFTAANPLPITKTVPHFQLPQAVLQWAEWCFLQAQPKRVLRARQLAPLLFFPRLPSCVVTVITSSHSWSPPALLLWSLQRGLHLSQTVPLFTANNMRWKRWQELFFFPMESHILCFPCLFFDVINSLFILWKTRKPNCDLN